jgi:hypothetical protein
VPPDVVSLNLTIVSRGKRNKDSEVAELSIDLAGLKNGQETEEWYPLNGMTPMGEWGSIRLRMRYLDDLGNWIYKKFQSYFIIQCKQISCCSYAMRGIQPVATATVRSGIDAG